MVTELSLKRHPWFSHLLRLQFLILFVAASAATSFSATPAQEAEVTFYSNASVLSGALPYTRHAAFYGAIFDGSNRLAVITHGRFLTLRLAPGRHIFSASFSRKHPAKNSQLILNLSPGKQYYIRADAEYKGVVLVLMKGRLAQVSCQLAHQEAGATKPLQQKRIAPNARAEVLASASMPPCN